ncbi:MAG: DUF4423 domain-containing protein [Acidobacteria bacterium]|nr:DUF4423 domain-containing protein [Acidobacteriota bacterium]
MKSVESPGEGDAADFRTLLARELARRSARNPSYSLRAFAQQLGLDHATLSQLLRGRRALTARTIEQLGEKLGLTADERSRQIAREEARRPGDGLREVVQLSEDALSLAGDGAALTILELVKVNGFRADARWVAEVLGISVDEVNITLFRLLRLGLLEMTSEGWKDRTGDAALSLDRLEAAALTRIADELQRALESGRGTHLSTTLAIDVARLPEARERLRAFRDELSSLLSGTDDVFRLELHLFPATKLKKET